MQIIPLLLLTGLIIVGSLILAIIRQLSGWNSVYERLAKRYGGNAFSAYLFSKPSMTFNYGRTFCRVHNRKSFRFAARKKTELVLGWLDNTLKLEITTSQRQPTSWNPKRLAPVNIERPAYKYLQVFSNKPDVVHSLLSNQVQWQLEQLRRHGGQEELHVSINRGKMSIAKPGYLKNAEQLDDFIRFGLELYDLMLLTDVQGIEFVNDGQANLIEDVRCPVCSEAIQHQMVICIRCKTPHCYDCWQYNGQCATFACHETRYMKSSGSFASS